MLKKKIKVTWLFTSLILTSLLMIIGFIYINFKFNFEQFNFPVKGLNAVPRFKLSIQGENGNGLLNGPLAVAVGKDKVYVTDTKGHQINVYSKKGKFLFSFGQEGVKNGQFIYPNALAVDNKNKIYVGEFQNHRIQVFEPTGQYIRTISGTQENIITPLAIAIYNETLYIAERTGDILITDLKGKVLNKFGTPGAAQGLLNYPNGLAIAGDGRIFVSDTGNGRVQIFSPQGTYLQTLDNRNTQLNLPRGIAFDDLGQLFLIDTFNHSILGYNENLSYIYSFGDRGMEEGQFNFPNGIAIDGDYLIYITDRENNRVQVFGYH